MQVLEKDGEVITTPADAPLVLVVDDDQAVRDLVAEILVGEMGVPAARARDGQEALELVDRRPPALVLLDLSMPRVDGFEVCRRLKADPATSAIPLVAMSAGERRQPALECGCDDVIAKPFDLDRLIAVAERWLGEAPS